MKNYTLVGQGLSGTGWMRQCLEKTGLIRRLDIYEERAHTKHAPKNHPCNILYIYADPRDILTCAVNRSLGETNVYNSMLYRHCEQLSGDYAYVAGIQTPNLLEHILNMIYDPMQLEEHFLRWLNTEIDYKLMMLKYEALSNPETYQEVLNFFEIKGDYSYEWKPRKTSYLDLPIQQQSQITKLFENLLKIQKEIPSVYIRNKK